MFSFLIFRFGNILVWLQSVFLLFRVIPEWIYCDLDQSYIFFGTTISLPYSCSLQSSVLSSSLIFLFWGQQGFYSILLALVLSTNPLHYLCFIVGDGNLCMDFVFNILALGFAMVSLAMSDVLSFYLFQHNSKFGIEKRTRTWGHIELLCI